MGREDSSRGQIERTYVRTVDKQDRVRDGRPEGDRVSQKVGGQTRTADRSYCARAERIAISQDRIRTIRKTTRPGRFFKGRVSVPGRAHVATANRLRVSLHAMRD